jgi:hypothetical protein
VNFCAAPTRDVFNNPNTSSDVVNLQQIGASSPQAAGLPAKSVAE